MNEKYTEKYWLQNTFWTKTVYLRKIYVVQIEIRL